MSLNNKYKCSVHGKTCRIDVRNNAVNAVQTKQLNQGNEMIKYVPMYNCIPIWS